MLLYYSRVASCHAIIRYIVYYDASCCDYTTFPYSYPRTYNNAASEPRIVAYRYRK